MKMLIVDDEVFAREAVIDNIAWSSYGIEVQGVSGGREALHYMEENRIDILMTDIRMPEMDGLMLLEEIGARNKPPGIIVLSSYNEFELVRGAMRLGAEDYLFKPSMMPEDILSTVLKVKARLENKQKTEGQITRKSVIEQLLKGQAPHQDVMECFLQEAMPFGQVEVFVVSLKLVGYKESLNKIFCQDIKLMEFTVQNVLCEVVGTDFSCEVSAVSYQEYIVAGWCKEPAGREELIKRIRERLSSVITFLKLYYSLIITAGVSLPAKNFSNLDKQVFQAQEKNSNMEAEPICFAWEESGKAGIRSEISNALPYIEDHLGDKGLSLAAVAAHIGVSKNYFSKIFKKEMGESFVQYITYRRMEQARNLYLNTELKIYEIAELVGYSDWHYLYVNYKKMFGHSLSREKEDSSLQKF